MTVPRRRWTFSLRTLFVVVTLAGCWLGYALNWSRQRSAFLSRNRMGEFDGQLEVIVAADDDCSDFPIRPMPWSLWAVGEKGIRRIYTGPELTPDVRQQMAKLFPEAFID
jgi:hypothetical protein